MRFTAKNCFKRVNQFIAMTLCAVFCVSMLSSSIFATENKNTVKVACVKNSAIFHKTDDGEYEGYGYEYLAEIAKYTGWKYEYVQADLQECFDLVESGKADIMLPVSYTDARAQIYDYSDYELCYSVGTMYTLIDKDIYFNDFNEFNGMKVALVEGNSDNINFFKFCQENDFLVTVKYAPDTDSAFQMLRDGKVDSVVAQSIVASGDIKVISRFNIRKSFFVTTKGNKKILDGINHGLEEIYKENIYFGMELYEKYFGSLEISKRSFTRDELDYINKNPQVKIAMRNDFYPIEYYDKETKRFKGINADLLTCIEQYTGLKFEHVSHMDDQDVVNLGQSGEADVISAFQGTIEQYGLLPSESYNEVTGVVIGLDEILVPTKDTRVAYIPALGIGVLAQKTINAKFIEYKTVDDCIKAVETGDADATIVATQYYDYLLRRNETGKFKVLSVLSEVVPISFGVPKGADPRLLSILNKAIERISAEQYNQAVVANTVGDTTVTFSGFISRYGRYVFVGAVIVALIIAAFVVLNRIHTLRRLKSMAYTDTLTGDISFERFRLEAEALFAKYEPDSYLLLYLDIDRFKYINDSYGYSKGNELLVSVSKSIREVLYDYETFTRFSADNFIVLLRNTSEKVLVETIRRIERSVQFKDVLGGDHHKISLSVGAYHIMNGTINLYEAMDKANMARKTIKQKHGSSYAFYDEKLHQKLLQDEDLVEKMENALLEHEFKVYLQPKIDLHTEKANGAEALVRWQREDKLIPPDRFIPLFEHNGFITKLDFYVFEETCRMLKNMIDNKIEARPISVNLSRVHMQSPDFIHKLCTIAGRYNTPLSLLELEITESAMQQNQENILSIVEHLKEHGFSVSMDDFGTGYSSLNLLKLVQMDTIKIDKSFLDLKGSGERERILLRDIVEMAHDLDMKVLAEGVETEQQKFFLQGIGCNSAQGYLFARPMPYEDYLEFLEREG